MSHRQEVQHQQAFVPRSEYPVLSFVDVMHQAQAKKKRRVSEDSSSSHPMVASVIAVAVKISNASCSLYESSSPCLTPV